MLGDFTCNFSINMELPKKLGSICCKDTKHQSMYYHVRASCYTILATNVDYEYNIQNQALTLLQMQYYSPYVNSPIA